MARTDSVIKKLEKGPLQRFKNSNLLMKKFGELGLQIYRVITGKRTAEELRKDLDIEEDTFWSIIDYMKEAGMVELTSTGEVVVETQKKGTKTSKEEEISFLPDEEKDTLSIEPEEKVEKKEKKREPAPDLDIPDLTLEIAPEKDESEEKEEPEEKIQKKEDASLEEEKEQEPAPDEKETSVEEPPAEPPEEHEDLEPEKQEDFGVEEPPDKEESSLNTAERMIKERFGEVGLKVYTLIDGTRTTQEIMDETGVSDTKLVEILNFLEERGIIKMEERDRASAGTESKATKEEALGDVLAPDEDLAGVDPRGFPTIDTPVKVGVDIVKNIRAKADILLKFGDKGTKVFESIDGKRDMLDIALVHSMPLYELMEIINFLFEKGAILLKPMKRLDIKRKYGDAGFSVYKKYGREGVLLYELIDKNLSIKQMAQRITKDKDKFLDMFLFIRKVLNIEIPIDKEVLMKQLA